MVKHAWRWTLALLAAVALGSVAVHGQGWLQFRGPNASGLSSSADLVFKSGTQRTVVWQTPVPAGHSSPVLTRDTIYLTAVEQNLLLPNRLFVLALDRRTGEVKWRRQVPRSRRQPLHRNNNPASPTPVSDGRDVYAFFGEFGLISFDEQGRERWRLPLGPFNNEWGMGASPILVDDALVLVCDQDSGSFMLAVDKNSGDVLWRVERPQYSRGFSTPVVHRPGDGPPQIIVAGSYRLAAYTADTGSELWWAHALSWQVKPTPIVSGDLVFAESWAAGGDPGEQVATSTFDYALVRMDANGNGVLSRDEVDDPALLSLWAEVDLDKDNTLNKRDWDFYRDRRAARNGMVAYRLGGHGDVTESHVAWRYERALPNVPSPLLYEGVLYMLKEGGILTALDPDTGRVLKQGRVAGAVGNYFASPVAAGGKLIAVTQDGRLVIVRAGADWDVLSVEKLGEDTFATPALDAKRLYVRTVSTLYAFEWR